MASRGIKGDLFQTPDAPVVELVEPPRLVERPYRKKRLRALERPVHPRQVEALPDDALAPIFRNSRLFMSFSLCAKVCQKRGGLSNRGASLGQEALNGPGGLNGDGTYRVVRASGRLTRSTRRNGDTEDGSGEVWYVWLGAQCPRAALGAWRCGASHESLDLQDFTSERSEVKSYMESPLGISGGCTRQNNKKTNTD